MATPEEIEQAAVGATLKMEELGYKVFELPRHDERGIAVLLASKGKEQRVVCAAAAPAQAAQPMHAAPAPAQAHLGGMPQPVSASIYDEDIPF